jgi:hypothetical protein
MEVSMSPKPPANAVRERRVELFLTQHDVSVAT